MLQTVLIILAVLAAIVVLLLILVALQPSAFRVARSTKIAATPAAVFEHVNDFHKWNAWNPWGKIDPAMKQTYEGAPAGQGAKYSWVGNKDVGEGRMTIVESRPGNLVRIDMQFIKPFAGTSVAEFTFQPEGGGTTVTWSMSSTKNFMMKGMHLIMNMDKMIGGQFEKGLADMKREVEAVPAK